MELRDGDEERRGVEPADPNALDPTSTAPARRRRAAAPRTRTSAAFRALIVGLVVLILLLVFILENTERVKISYFGASGHLSLGVALLIAAVGGGIVTAAVGTARIVQLRRQARRQRRS